MSTVGAMVTVLKLIAIGSPLLPVHLYLPWTLFWYAWSKALLCSLKCPLIQSYSSWRCTLQAMLKVGTQLWGSTIIPWLVDTLLFLCEEGLGRKQPQSVMFKPSACWSHYVEALQMHSYIININTLHIQYHTMLYICPAAHSISASIHFLLPCISLKGLFFPLIVSLCYSTCMHSPSSCRYDSMGL